MVAKIQIRKEEQKEVVSKGVNEATAGENIQTSVTSSTRAMSSTNTSMPAQASMYEKLTLWVVTLTALLLPVFIVPYSNVNFLFAKSGLVTVAVLIASIALTLQVLSDRQVERYSILNYVWMFGIPVLYVVSSLFSAHPSLSLMGNGAEIDTAYFYFLGAFLMYLVSRVFRSKHSVFMLVLGFVSIASLVSAFHIVRFIFGKDFASFNIFTTITSNTIGGFNEFGIYAGLASLLAVLALELVTLRQSVRALLYVSLALVLSIVVVTNFSLFGNFFVLPFGLSLTFLIALCALVLFIHKKVVHPKVKLPIASLSLLFISLICTIGMAPISSFLLPKIDVTQNEILDVRVSPRGTYQVASKTYQDSIKHALIGVGPNKFFTAWGAHKPLDPQQSINATPFWNVDFNLASGLIPTSFITVGILGGLAWVFFLGLLIYYISRLLKQVALPEKDQASVFVAWAVSMGTMYLWVTAFFFTPGPTTVFLAFIFSGLLIATLVREDIIKVKNVSWDVATYWKGFLLTLGMIVLIVVFMCVGYLWQQRLYASMLVQQATKVLQADTTKVSDTQTILLKAINTYFNPSDLRFASEVSLIRPTNLISKAQGIVPAEKITSEVLSDITFAINTARRSAIDKGLSPDYRDWIQLGKTYEAATFLGATSTATLAVEAYAEAERLNPTSPIPPYLIGRLYAFARGFDVAGVKLQRAIDLKPDYKEAVDLLNSVREASKSSQRSTTVTPTPTTNATSTKATPTKATPAKDN